MDIINRIVAGLIAVLVLGALTGPFLGFVEGLNLTNEQQALVGVVTMLSLVWGAVRIIE